MRFKELENNDYNLRVISKKLNNGDFDYWLVIEVLYMNEYVPNPEFKYMVTLQAVSPDEAGPEQLKEALSKVTYNNALYFFTKQGVKGSEHPAKIEFYSDAMQKYLNILQG